MNQRWKEVLITPDAHILRAIEIIDAGMMQAAFVVDEQRVLLGVVTDGDIRRGILRGIPLDAPVRMIMKTEPLSMLSTSTREEIFQLMKQREVRHMPLLDSRGVIVGVYSLTDFFTLPRLDNWVVIMAGGLGTRLAPLTNTMPKPMLKVGDKPILETILEGFIQQGFSRFFFSVNYLSGIIQDYFGNGERWNVRIEYLQENQRLGTAGALALLPEKPHLPLLVMNGDLLTKVNFQSLLEFHIEHQSAATMCVREYDFQVPYGVVNVEQHRITTIVEKPIHKFFVNAGIYVLSPESLLDLPKDEFYDMPTLFDNLIASKKIACSFPIREYWMDIGRMSDYERANEEFPEIFR